jgi:cystathionine gamma-synthase
VEPETRPDERSSDSHLVPVLDRATIHAYVAGEPRGFYYQRYGHATGAEAEALLGELDGGRALLFASGSAAGTAVVLGLLAPGQTIALAAGAYFGTSVLFSFLGRWGVRFVEFDQAGPPPDGVDLVWLEAPANPYLTFPDLEAAAAHPARVLVDATVATPVLLRPLQHGADLVLHSATKYLGGHSDILLGAVVCGSAADHDALLQTRTKTGMTAAPDAAWLLMRGLRTLELRVRRQSETALELARRLQRHPRVARVHYPGLGNRLAARYLDGGFGGLLSFEVADAATARAVETTTRLIANATSLGGVESLIESRHRWEGDRVPEGLLRLSAGLEDVDDLWADLAQALDRAAVPEEPEVGLEPTTRALQERCSTS